MDAGVMQRMREVEGAVLELDESVRAAAFSMMEGYVLSGRMSSTSTPTPGSNAGGRAEPPEPGDLGDFFQAREVGKPAEAVMAITAYLFQEFGSEPFTPQEIRGIADEVGLTVSERIDMTLKSAKKNGKPLFRSVGRSKYAPTVYGEATLKADYNVAKGRRKKASSTEGNDQ